MCAVRAMHHMQASTLASLHTDFAFLRLASLPCLDHKKKTEKKSVAIVTHLHKGIHSHNSEVGLSPCVVDEVQVNQLLELQIRGLQELLSVLHYAHTVTVNV